MSEKILTTTWPNNERVIILNDGKTFTTEDDKGTWRVYEGAPPEDLPIDLIIRSNELTNDV